MREKNPQRSRKNALLALLLVALALVVKQLKPLVIVANTIVLILLAAA